ncbi:MAG: DEAD/DEAH box helicase [Nitrososphaerales archaeon]
MVETFIDVFAQFAKPIRKAIHDHGFLSPTEPQIKAIPLITSGKNVLLVAPTGTGKTEAAFLPILNKLYTMEEKVKGIKVLYITPLRALNRDLLERLEWWCKRLDLRLAVRHGDTEVKERGMQALVPPDILITTPETLQVILVGKVIRNHLKSVRWVIVDEVHELAVDKRGSQLSLALERLRYITGKEFQIIGLSATIGTPEEVAHFLVGSNRTCEIVKVPVAKSMQIQILYPEADKIDYELASKLYTYPEVAARLRIIRELILKNHSVLIFTNTRSEAEILASRFRVWDSEFPLSVHHGSLSKPSRLDAERKLKDGKLYGIICTSSLELGIDIGPLEMVIQYNSPRQVTRLIQRVGRSGHKIGGIAKGVIITQDSDDTLEAMVIARRAYLEDLEPVSIPNKPFDVLTHQLVGLLFHKNKWSFEEVLNLCNQAYPYRNLTLEDLMKVLNYMYTRYPRLCQVLFEHKLFNKPPSIRGFYEYYFQNLSMIPDTKQYLVLKEDGLPIGVLDEEFVAEYGEIGTKFVEGGSLWKIVQVYQDKVYVKPDDDPTGAIPSWVGEEIPVSYEVASEVGSIRRFVELRLNEGASIERIVNELCSKYPIDKNTLMRALHEIFEQIERKIPIPNDKRVMIEAHQDYAIINCCFGHLVNRCLARLLAHLLSERLGLSVGVYQDPYRIYLKAPNISPNDIRDLLINLADQDIQKLAVKALVKTGIFIHRLIHVAKKFGVIGKDSDLSSVKLKSLIESLQGSIIYEEAVRTMLEVDVDITRTAQLIQSMRKGEIEIVILKDDEFSPISKIGLQKVARRAELIKPDRLKRIILESTRARLLNEGKTIVCVDCWDYVDTKAIKDLHEGFKCPLCSSSKLALIDESEEKMRLLCSSIQIGKVPKRFKRIFKKALRISELYMTYGFPAAVVLAGKGISVSEASKILEKESNVNDKLIELIIEAEKRALKRRYFIS